MIELRYGREQMIPADGIDLSSKGLLCASDVPVEPHSRIFLMFHLPLPDKAHEIQCEGIVVRSVPEDDQYEVAIQFIDVGGAEQSAIDAFVDQSSSTEKKP